MSIYNRIFSKFNKKNILVVGDSILDKYIQGNVSRLSPEAPVPVVLEREAFFAPGGAASVAHNLSCLNAKVTLIGRIGDDAEGEMLKQLLKKKKVDIRGLFVDKKLPTTCKTRVIAQNQQIVRIDRETIKSLTKPEMSRHITGFIEKNVSMFDAVIISDYGKGLITPDLVNFIRVKVLEKNKIIIVDPKVEHFAYYRNVTAITPNLNEAENAIRNIKITSKSSPSLGIHNDKLKTDKDINLAGMELLRYLELESLLITLGEHGMRLFEKGKKPVSIKTKAREVYDVSGAGDAVISAFALSLAAGATKREAAEIANFAGGIVVGKRGAATATVNELMEAIKRD